ncbi:MAG: exosortase/archaeosortase family protein, partial [Gemmataceae bacterium]
MLSRTEQLSVASLAAGLVGLLVGLLDFWLKDYESLDRILIYGAAAWVGAELAPHVLARGATPRPLLGALCILVGVLVFLPAWFVFTQVGSRAILFWVEQIGLVLAAAGYLLARYGAPVVLAARFPLFFPFLGLPLPGRIDALAKNYLQNWTTTLADQMLQLSGISVRRDGYLLTLPSGDLGVVEACSGMKSMNALTAVAVYLAYTRGFGPLRFAITLLFAIPVIVLVNALRVTFTGFLQEWFGRWAIVGWRHDALGMAVVLLGLVIIAAFTTLVARGLAPSQTPPPPPAPAPRRVLLPAIILLLGLGTALAILCIPNIAVSVSHDPDLSTLPRTVDRWQSTDQPIEEDIRKALGSDRVLYRVYSHLGQEAHVWIMHWKSANGVRDYHHPDVCWPNRGYTLRQRSVEPIHTPGGRDLPLTYREFSRGREAQFLVYWT